MNQEEAIQIIEPEQAAALLQPQIEALCAEGWVVILQTDYDARLTRGDSNLDLHIDLLGELSITESPLTDVQKIGQIVALILVMVSFLVLLTLVSVLGLLD